MGPGTGSSSPRNPALTRVKAQAPHHQVRGFLHFGTPWSTRCPYPGDQAPRDTLPPGTGRRGPVAIPPGDLAQCFLFAGQAALKIRDPAPPKPWLDLRLRDWGTAAVVFAGLLIAFTRLRGRRWLRLAFQVVLVAYLGFVNADMLSQALLVGFSMAVFYAGAISPTFVLRKTFVYGATIAVFLFVFSVLQELIISSLVDNLGVSDGLVGAIFAALFGLAFYPVTRRIERLVRRDGPADQALLQSGESAGPTRD